MFFGDIVTITPTGVLASKKALRPVGIYDQSICWGVWVANPHPDHEHYKHPNLIISPFHPSSWPFLVRLRLVLENRKGALADASGLLEENDLSIVFAECTPTGFRHVTWTVIAESTWGKMDKLRARKEDFDREHRDVRLPTYDGYREARRIANSIAAHMMTHVRRLEHVFKERVARQRVAEQQGRAADKLFHLWSAEGEDHFLYDGEQVAKEMVRLKQGALKANREYLRSRLSGPAEVSYIHRLAYFSIYGGGEEVPLRFQYDANANLVETTEQSDPFTKGRFALAPLPMHAIGAFNSEEKFLRLCPVTPEFLRRPLARIDLDYEVKQAKHDAKASQGLLRRLCDKLRNDVDHLHVWNKLTKHRYYYEEGRVTFVADVDPAEYRGVEEKLKAINDVGTEERLEAVTINGARVYEYPMKKLFLSIHFGHPREKCIRQLVERAALAEGFMYVEVRTYTRLVTKEVNEQIRECSALLQLLYSDADPSVVPLPPWIQHEYSTALAEDKPTFQLVDISKFDLDKWRVSHVINPDQALRPFRLDVSDDELYEVIREAVEELAEWTRGVPQR